MNIKKIAEAIPHQRRQQILLDWLPTAKADMSNESFRLLWEAYFIYVDPDAVKKTDCPRCLQNVLDVWKGMAEALQEAEQEYNALEKIA